MSDAPTHENVEERLREIEERFRLFMESVREYAIFMLDPEGRVVDWNLGAEHVLGYGADIVGQPFSVFFPPDDRDAGNPEQELKKAIESGQASDDRWHVRKDGTYFWALGITTAMRDPDGTLKGFTKVLRDSTERKRFEEQLNERNVALQAADQRKDEFLAVLAHELRNPLSPILTSLSILENETISAEQQRNARNVIGRQIPSLARLVDDLLDVSRITRGKIQLQKTEIRFRDVISNAVESCATSIERKQHQLNVSKLSGDIWVEGDRTRLEQVVVNLLDNAAKYCPSGSTISVSVSADKGKLVLRVGDNGIGISADILPKIFDMFMQADASLERSQGGLGVGLTLAKKLIELHDGSIEAFSDGPGKGCEFVVKLPLLTPQAEVVASDRLIDQSRLAKTSLRILVIDDNVDAVQTLAVLLTLNGHDVTKAHTGIEGLEAASDCRPDVVLLDIGLPGLNGYQVAQRLRSRPDSKDIVLVAMTGYGQEEDRKRALSSGFDHRWSIFSRQYVSAGEMPRRRMEVQTHAIRSSGLLLAAAVLAPPLHVPRTVRPPTIRTSVRGRVVFE